MARTAERLGSDDTDAEELRCPSCRAVKWYRDGLWIRGTRGGRVVSERLVAARGGDQPWSCSACGETVFSFMRLHVRLEQVAEGETARAHA